MTDVLEVQDLWKDYHTGEEVVHALAGVSLQARAGEFLAIMGASGSGKSTLLHLIGGLDAPTRGRVVIDGEDIGSLNDFQRTLFRRRRLGFVFQAFNLLPTLSALENVSLPLLLNGQATEADISGKAASLLDAVDLGHRSKHRPQALSGGEQQRVAVARALANDPAMLLADEPTGNLDSKHAAEIWSLLSALSREQKRTVLVVTHEAHWASYADRVVVLKDGKCVGEFEPAGDRDATLVATRYAELAG